jgi:hypothetical protein
MRESFSTVLDLLTRTDFQAGVIAGAAGLVVLLAARNDERPSKWWGEMIVVATVAAGWLTQGRRLGLLLGVLTLWIGGRLVDRKDRESLKIAGSVLIVAGACLIAWRGGFEISWLPLLTAVAILASGLAFSRWSDRLPQNVLGTMVAITAFGVWVTVPETEQARILLGAALPLAVATLPPVNARLSHGGAFALAGVIAWIVAIGGEARPASIIGGWACLGAIAFLPLARPDASRVIKDRPILVIGLHAVFVLIASRVIGLWESATMALIAVLFVAVGALLAIGAVTGRPETSE